MAFSRSILDDKQHRDKIAQAIEEARNRPFSFALEEWLRDQWVSRSSEEPWIPSVLSLMARKEDLGFVQHLPERQVEAFYLCWDAGLFDDAHALAKESDDVRKAVGFKYADQDGPFFEMCQEFASIGIWGRCRRMLGFLAHVRGIGRETQTPPELRNVLLLGPEGTEKKKLAEAIHRLAGREEFLAIQFPLLKENPRGQVEACQYGGTVFLEEAALFPPEWRAPFMQALEERREKDVLFK